MGCYAVSATYVLDKQVIESMHAKYTAVEISARDTKDEKNKVYELVTLISRCFLVFFCICFVAVFWGHHWFFLKSVILNLTGKKLFCSRLKKGRGIGLTLGLGLWIKARLKERKACKKNQ